MRSEFEKLISKDNRVEYFISYYDYYQPEIFMLSHLILILKKEIISNYKLKTLKD